MVGKLNKYFIFNFTSILFIFFYCNPLMAISIDSSNFVSKTTIGSKHISYGNYPASFSTLPLIAGIDHSDSKKDNYRIVEFTLKENSIIRIYARGKGDVSRMLDYGAIENSRTGQILWIMRFLSTKHAGGTQKNRKVDRVLPLRAGTYRLHFKTSSAKPDSFTKGMWLFNETENHKNLLGSFWEKASDIEELGWSNTKLNNLVPELIKLGTDALMVITDSKIVFEYGNTANIIRSHSTRKSLLSALYGIYIADGKIDLNATLGQLRIVDSTPLTDSEKQATVMDLLKARSGVYIPAAAEAESMRKARPKRGEHKPGSFWYYNNWDFNVLGTIFRQETNQDIYMAFKQRISDPIGFQDFILDRQSYSYQKKYSLHPSYPFLISTRDMAKFGQLFLQRGQWNKKQIISEHWITNSTRSYSKTKRSGIGYGYMWWILTQDIHGLQKGCYFADGYGGQRLYVIPHINSVVAHRINIKVPGTNDVIAELAPDAVIKRIMKAYTGNEDMHKKSISKEIKTFKTEKILLKNYGRSSDYYGKTFHRFRIFFWICAAVLTSGFVIWTMIYFFRRFFYRIKAIENHTGKGHRFGNTLKWIAAIGGLLCSIYIFIILSIPYALEYVAIIGMPSDLNIHQNILMHVPKLGVFFAFTLLIANILIWIKKFWTIFERIHFVLITIASVVFVSLAYNLNLVILM